MAERGSVLSVFDAVASCGEISRARLSEMTGFSQVTVGKAVDLLDSAGVLVQYKQNSGSVGRKTGICRLNTELGMLLFELTESETHIQICDISLDTRVDRRTSEPLCDSFISGFTEFVEHFGDGLLGIGCVVPDGMADEYRRVVTDALGHEPELVVCSGRAFAAANDFRFDTDGFALYLRIVCDGTVTGALINDGAVYYGSHGRGGDFVRIPMTRESLCDRLAELCAVLDPSLIHIACEDDRMCDEIAKSVLDRLASLYSPCCAPEVVVESVSACRDSVEGAARLLREAYILSKTANNS